MTPSNGQIVQKLYEILLGCLDIIKKKIERVNQINNFYKENETKEKFTEELVLLDLVNHKIKTSIKIFKFIQLLCEGHNNSLQNFLRDQNNSANVNFISATALMFGGLVKYLKPEIIDLANKMLEFMIESIQGPCKENQKSLFQAKVVDYVKDLMNEFDNPVSCKAKGFESKEDQEVAFAY